MADYLTVPILDELVRRVEEDSSNEDTVEAMSSAFYHTIFLSTSGSQWHPRQRAATALQVMNTPSARFNDIL